MSTRIYEDSSGGQVVSASNGPGRGQRLEFDIQRIDTVTDAMNLAEALLIWAADVDRAAVLERIMGVPK